jgi:2-polyprenyl-3-methyl-5-hydroxy-6-metoxy-1,4-benzoquinol methylase
MCGDESARHKILGLRLNSHQGLHPRRKSGIAVSVVKCSNCHLYYNNPRPIPHDFQDHYGISPGQYWKEDYFKIDPNYFSVQIARAKELIRFQPGMKALDVGAGIGKCMIALKNAGFNAHGFEPSRTFYDAAIDMMGISRDNFRRGMIEDMSYEPGTFDFITFGAVLEHMYNPSEAIAKAMSWLKPGGVLHLEVPSSRHLVSRMINAYYRVIGTSYVTNTSPMHSPYHLYEFALKSFQENQKVNNYTIVFHKYYVCEIVGIPKLFHPFLRWYMHISHTGMQLEVWLRKNSNPTS